MIPITNRASRSASGHVNCTDTWVDLKEFLEVKLCIVQVVRVYVIISSVVRVTRVVLGMIIGIIYKVISLNKIIINGRGALLRKIIPWYRKLTCIGCLTSETKCRVGMFIFIIVTLVLTTTMDLV